MHVMRPTNWTGVGGKPSVYTASVRARASIAVGGYILRGVQERSPGDVVRGPGVESYSNVQRRMEFARVAPFIRH